MMVRFFSSRRRDWPSIDTYQPGGRGDIKSLTIQDLDSLMTKAARMPWSAVGRPGWFKQHRGRIARLMVVVFGVEEPVVYRCLVVAILDDDSGCSFTLDVAFDDFNRLPDVTPGAVVTMAHRYLAGFPPLELDPDQEQAWKRLENL